MLTRGGYPCRRGHSTLTLSPRPTDLLVLPTALSSEMLASRIIFCLNLTGRRKMLNKTHAPFGELSASLPSGRYSEPSPRVFLSLAPARDAASTSSPPVMLEWWGMVLASSQKSCREVAATKTIPTPSVLSSAP